METNYWKNYPMSFGVHLQHNPNAMDYFTSLTQAERNAVAAECEAIASKDEMRAYVEGLGRKKH
ncbi:MAG: hypothetical protein LBM28_02680 [Oscillospiraceae bacterium]|jgi:hypothetical protein|nr:hypothetical protein [Oscillospiraceae bacterium]